MTRPSHRAAIAAEPLWASDLQAALFALDAPAAKTALQKLKAPCGRLFPKLG